MGCISSKILTKSKSLQEELSQTLYRRSNGVEELFGPKNGGDQLLALFYTADTVSKATKAVPVVSKESETNSATMIEDTAPDHTEMTGIVHNTEIETINKWELLDGLEEESEAGEDGTSKGASNSSSIMKNSSNNAQARSFRTAEEYDALFAVNNLEKEMKYTAVADVSNSTIPADINDRKKQGVEEKEAENHRRRETAAAYYQETDSTGVVAIRSDQKSSKRKTMAKDLAVLDIPSFDFPRIGSLKDWLGGGGGGGMGKVNSPGNYITPKFGHPPEQVAADHSTVFDPDMISQYEQAMMQLTEDEEFILNQIIESSEEDKDLESIRTEMLQELIMKAHTG